MDIYTEQLRTDRRRSFRENQSAGRIQPRSPFSDRPRLVADMSQAAIDVRVAAIAAALAPVLRQVDPADAAEAASWIRDARARTGMSQAAVAQRIGISRSALAVAEQGRWHVSRARLEEILDAIDSIEVQS